MWMSWDLPAAIAARAMCHADNAYEFPMRITSLLPNTTQSNTAFRGFGGQSMFGIEGYRRLCA
ncbi:MAG: hypothetical protein CM15mP95_2640 [Alphaproteobacteria bacterium]|nr:MAG: hypothetical protein CM15mP95_2640 [Alphaproteobacteria bacterium]